MKELLIQRHGEAGRKQPGMTDHQKPLTPRGISDAERMGRHVKTVDIVPDIIVHSDAMRTTQTAKAFIEGCSFDGKVISSPEIYLAPAERYLDFILTLPASAKRAMFIGHNPGVESLIETLTGDYQGFYPATLARISLDITDWSDGVSASCSILKGLWRPNDV